MEARNSFTGIHELKRSLFVKYSRLLIEDTEAFTLQMHAKRLLIFFDQCYALEMSCFARATVQEKFF